MAQLESDATPTRVRTAELSTPAPHNAPVILIIDDDATARLAIAAMLHRDDRIIMFATNAAEVPTRLGSIDPDVIVCDLIMDDMRGDELFRWLKSHDRWRLTPIIAITQIDHPMVRSDLLEAGADVVLSKATEPREVRAYVDAALRTRNTFKNLCDRLSHAAPGAA
jgi:DNA-binding response OmpR family regulator